MAHVSETENNMSLIIFHIFSKFQRNVSEGLMRLSSLFLYSAGVYVCLSSGGDSGLF